MHASLEFRQSLGFLPGPVLLLWLSSTVNHTGEGEPHTAGPLCQPVPSTCLCGAGGLLIPSKFVREATCFTLGFFSLLRYFFAC